MITIQVPKGYRATGYRRANNGESFLPEPGAVSKGPTPHPVIILEELVNTQELDIEVPKGWEAADWGIPKDGEHYLSNCGNVLKSRTPGFSNYRIIVERTWSNPTEAKGQEARFRDQDCHEWVPGRLVAMAYDEFGRLFFVDEQRTTWCQCEVKP